MKYLSIILVLFIFFISCNNNRTNNQIVEIQIDTLDVYPVYYNCENVQDSAQSLNCMWNNLAFFYNFHLGKVYKEKIKEINDTVKLSLAIDTLGYLKIDKIDYQFEEDRQVLDTILKKITSIVPKIKPAEYQGKKVKFKFKQPIIFSSDNFISE